MEASSHRGNSPRWTARARRTDASSRNTQVAPRVTAASGWEVRYGGGRDAPGSSNRDGGGPPHVRIGQPRCNSHRAKTPETHCQKAAEGKACTLTRVKGHSGVKGNEEANYRGTMTVLTGRFLHRRNITTPAGIKQAHRLYQPSTPVKNWNRQALRGLTYIVTDRGPFKHWLHQIGRAEDGNCRCGEIHISELVGRTFGPTRSSAWQ